MGCLNNVVKLGKCFTQQGNSLTRHKTCVKNANEKIEWLKRYNIDIDNKSKCNRESSPRDKWYNTNKNIIMALSRVLKLHADAVADFLYTLTMQNFSQVLNPRGQQWNRCRVPLTHFEVCDVYCDIFDKDGNVRSPYHPKSLSNLLSIIQLMLKAERKDANNGNQTNLFGNGNKPEKISRAVRAGIGEDSLAWQNGRRRRLKEYENFQLDGNGLTSRKVMSAGIPDDRHYDYSGNSFPFGNLITSDKYFDSQTNPLAAGIGMPGDGNYDSSKNPFASLFDRNGNPFLTGSGKGEGNTKCAPWDKKCSSEHGTQLKNLIKHVKDQVGIHRDYLDIVHGVKNLNLYKAHESELHRTKGQAKAISDNYHTITMLGQGSQHSTRRRQPRSTQYYGAQVPILVHEPFNSEKPWTWIRRHPRANRMNEQGSIVDNSNIHRYKRQSVELQLKIARKRGSVHTMYSENDSVSSRLTSKVNDIIKNAKKNRYAPTGKKSFTRMATTHKR